MDCYPHTLETHEDQGKMHDDTAKLDLTKGRERDIEER